MRETPTTKDIIIYGIIFIVVFMATVIIGTAEGAETADRPAQDLVYVAEINGFKVPVIIPKGIFNPEHRGKTWQTKDQYNAEWERALQWKDEILKEEESKCLKK